MVCSLLLALLLNQPIKGRTFFRSVFFFPHVGSIIAIAVVWNMLFNPDMGPVNQFLHSLRISDLPRWAASTTWVMPTIIFASIWRSMGYYMIIYLAALQSIPRELYESAKMDGANFWRAFIHITIPMLTPATFFVTIMLTISCFKVFDLIWMMTQGGPGRSSNVLVLHIYRSAFLEYRFGYASAVAAVLFLLVLCITIFQFRAERKWVNYM
jgi:multiple sugar transport system permease protein